MSLYIIVALLAYLGFAIAGIGDKFILSKTIKHPTSYAFFIGIFSPLYFIIAPFGLRTLPFAELLIALAGGACFIYALVFYYRAINQVGASKAVTMVGGIEPIFVLVLAFFIANERLQPIQLGAFLMMIAGTVLISLEKSEGKWSIKKLSNAIIAALFFAIAFALYKYVYNSTNFVSGLVWTRIGLFVGSASFLMFKSTRDLILEDIRTPKPRSGKFTFLGNYSMGALAGFLQNYAFSLGSVSIVTAMGGIQFAFILILTYLLSRFFPSILKEDISTKVLVQKITAIVLIGIGLIMVSL